MKLKERVIYYAFIIICLSISFGLCYQVAEARVIDWLLGGTHTVTVVLEEKVTYKLGDKIPEVVIDEIISRYATGTKAYQMKRTLFCESVGFQNVQSFVVTNGVREPSYGIAQIHEPSHPQVTREQALDPEFSIKFMSDNWGKVAWYGYIKSTDSCNTIYQ